MRKLLIIEDDAGFRRRLEEILSADGWDVSGADTGNQGLDAARAHCPDVVICDLLMPDGNGFQVCRSLREQPTLRGTKVLVISGRQFESDRKAAFEAGADEYLAKPFEMQQIREILERLAPGSAQGSKEASSPGGGEPTTLRFWGVRGSIPTPGPGTVAPSAAPPGGPARLVEPPTKP